VRSRGGVADNVIAAGASARLFVRLVTEPEETIDVLERWLAGRGELTVETTASPVLLGTVPGFLTTVVAFASDVPHLTNWGTRYLYGPGSIHVAHTDDEHVSVVELRVSVDAYVKLAEGTLGL
jgi:acetylornithine deacetylase